MSLQHAVVSARQHYGWTQQQLAAAARVAWNTVKRVERGQRVKPGNVVAICRALGIDPEVYL